LLARAYPQQGGRHEGAIVVAGFLCRCGFAAPDIKLSVDALAGVTSQPPDKRKDMVRAAADTAEAFVAGRNTFGLPKMKEVFGEPVTKNAVNGSATGPRRGAPMATVPPRRARLMGLCVGMRGRYSRDILRISGARFKRSASACD
jgi:hypothetical protein